MLTEKCQEQHVSQKEVEKIRNQLSKQEQSFQQQQEENQALRYGSRSGPGQWGPGMKPARHPLNRPPSLACHMAVSPTSSSA